MKFNFVISKLNNFYFFISNLTEFHLSCRPHFNKNWIDATGVLNQKEAVAEKIIEILEPARKHFKTPKNKEKLQKLKELLACV